MIKRTATLAEVVETLYTMHLWETGDAKAAQAAAAASINDLLVAAQVPETRIRMIPASPQARRAKAPLRRVAVVGPRIASMLQ
jgi:hypothetical protein